MPEKWLGNSGKMPVSKCLKMPIFSEEKEARRRRKQSPPQAKIFLSFNSVKMAVQLCFFSAHFHTLPYFFLPMYSNAACEILSDLHPGLNLSK